jgi:purine-binding chemotaxis protein CheW
MADSSTAVKAERQVVVFNLASEAYGVDVGTVREIIRVADITRVPNAPAFVRGVMNVRGKLIPVVDLGPRFGMEPLEQTGDSRIVVVDIGNGSVGVMVDAVSEVLRIADDCIEPAASLVSAAESYYIQGIANLGERLIILLTLDKLLSKEQQASLAHAKAAAE